MTPRVGDVAREVDELKERVFMLENIVYVLCEMVFDEDLGEELGKKVGNDVH